MSDIRQMRDYISRHPRYKNSNTWRDRVQRMPENQVIAIFYKFQKQDYKKIEREMKVEKEPVKEQFHQVTMFEYMEGV